MVESGVNSTFSKVLSSTEEETFVRELIRLHDDVIIASRIVFYSVFQGPLPYGYFRGEIDNSKEWEALCVHINKLDVPFDSKSPHWDKALAETTLIFNGREECNRFKDIPPTLMLVAACVAALRSLLKFNRIDINETKIPSFIALAHKYSNLVLAV
jgi:hypothetical protein